MFRLQLCIASCLVLQLFVLLDAKSGPHVIRLAAAPDGRLEFERGVQHGMDDSLKNVLRDHARKMLEGEETGVQVLSECVYPSKYGLTRGLKTSGQTVAI